MENLQLFFVILLDSQILMENLQLILTESPKYEEMQKITWSFSS